jgi:hypothetical protein
VIRIIQAINIIFDVEVAINEVYLYSWWANGISQEQKNAIEKLGIDASGSSNKRYDKQDLLKLWHWTKILERNRQDIGISKKIQQINFFSTEWNNNLTAVIDGEGSYGINIGLWDANASNRKPFIRKFRKIFCWQWVFFLWNKK